jgi:polysaccharide export outer membrane protein
VKTIHAIALPLVVALLISTLPARSQSSRSQSFGPSDGATDTRGPGHASDGQASDEQPSNEYVLGASDVVEVFVWKEPELSRTITVRPDGRISLPLAGELAAAGSTASSLQEQIERELRQYLDQPLVTVIVKEIKSPTISVLGEVRRPGRYVISQSTTALDAVAMSGGFTEFARQDRVTVFRRGDGRTEPVRVRLKRLLSRGGESFYLQPGDTVHVE